MFLAKIQESDKKLAKERKDLRVPDADIETEKNHAEPEFYDCSQGEKN